MICYLKGKILQKHLEFIILDVQGVGYEVLIPPNILTVLPSELQPIEMYISTYIREDSFRLYGFLTMFNKQIFEALLEVSGIGPKVALALLGSIDGFDLCHVIIAQQVSYLTKVPGIGAKTAERLILELKGKCQKLLIRAKEHELFMSSRAQTSSFAQGSSALSDKMILDDLSSALLNMGYKEKQFAFLLEGFQKRLKYGESLVFEGILKESLKKLSERILKG